MLLFILDKLLVLFLGVLTVLGITFIFPGPTSVILFIVCSTVWIVWCGPLLLLPLDFFLRPKTEVLFFQAAVFDNCEFFKKRCYALWHCRSESQKNVWIIDPNVLDETEHKNNLPQLNQRIAVTYYRFSRICISSQIME